MKSIESLLIASTSTKETLRILIDIYGFQDVFDTAKTYISEQRSKGLKGSSELAPLLLLYCSTSSSSSSYLPLILDNEIIMDDVFDSLLSDPSDDDESMMVDPIYHTLMNDPVIVSSGFIFDRKTAWDDELNQLRFQECPFTRQKLNPNIIIPVITLRNKVKEFQLTKLERCVEICEILVNDATQRWDDNANKAFTIAGEFLNSLGEMTYRQFAKRLAELEKSIPGNNTPIHTARIYCRLIRAAPTDDVAAEYVTEAVEHCLANATRLLDDDKPTLASEWIDMKGGPTADLFELISKQNLSKYWDHLKGTVYVKLLECEKRNDDTERVWEIQRILTNYLRGEELQAWLESENLTGQEPELLSFRYDTSKLPNATSWIKRSLGVFLVNNRTPSPQQRYREDLNPIVPGGDQWLEIAFRCDDVLNNPSWKNTIFSQHGPGTGWEIRCSRQHVELVWTTSNGSTRHSHNEFINRHVTIQLNEWVHVAVAYDGNSSRIKLFVNGQAETRRLIGRFIPDNRGSGLPLVGRNPFWPERHFNGLLAFPDGGQTLPVPFEDLESYVNQLSSTKLQALRAWEESGIDV